MRGLYIHIPFCSQACRYCDFFFSVSIHYMDEFVDRLAQEIEARGKEHPDQKLDTLYLGGGTPSLLSRKNLEKILKSVHDTFMIHEDAEITMECNPNDLNPTFLNMIKLMGFNRLSIGVQSFHEKDLQLLRRSHDAAWAERSIKQAASAGFENITMDLIYGIPDQSAREWEDNLSKAVAMPISHLSAYHLTFETGTVFDHWKKQRRLSPIHEEESVKFYRLLREWMLSAGYDHYEISNFSREGKMSKHNLLYWSGLPYLGVGPSAHSFDGSRRSWNIASMKGYMEAVGRVQQIGEFENLSVEERYHDYLITSLRTKWGADEKHLEDHFGEKFRKHFEINSAPFLKEGTMWNREGKTAIHPNHWLITDHILKKLFVD